MHQLNKQNAVYLYSGIFYDKKEWRTDTHNKHRWTLKHYAKWKKAITKDHILRFHLYEMSKTGQLIGQKVN